MPKYSPVRSKSSLRLNLTQVFPQRSILHPYVWMRRHGISDGIARRLMNDNYDRVPMTALSILCENLTCTPDELLVWKPLHPEAFPANHPLHAMRPKGNDVALGDKAAKLSTAQLKEINDRMEEMIKEGEDKSLPAGQVG